MNKRASDLLDKYEEQQRRITELEAVIEADRSLVADGVTALRRELDSRQWLTEGRGSYEWDDDRYREEFLAAGQALIKALQPLEKLAADLTNSPRTTDAVVQARRDKDKRITILEEALRPFAGHPVRLVACDGPVIIKDNCGNSYTGSILIEHFRRAYEVFQK